MKVFKNWLRVRILRFLRIDNFVKTIIVDSLVFDSMDVRKQTVDMEKVAEALYRMGRLDFTQI